MSKSDQASVSSFGSHGSSQSRASNASRRGQLNEEGGEEEDASSTLLNQNRGIIIPTFGVLKTLAEEKYDYLLRFAAAYIVLDFVQLLLLVLRPDYGFEINTDLWVWHAIKWVEFANPLTSESYTFYIAWMYVGVAILLCSLALAVWVSWCFSKNRFPYIWPVMLLRLLVNAMLVFYVSCFTVFLASFNCHWFMEGQGEIMTEKGTMEMVDLRFRMNRFPEKLCLEAPHLAHGIVGFIACGVYALAALTAALMQFEPDPASRRWLATSHSSVEIWALAAKTIMALNMAIFAGQLYIQSVIMCLVTLFLCYLYIRWQPHYNELVNHVRCGLYFMLFWTSVFIAIMKFDHRSDEPGHKKWLTDVMLIGLGPALPFGALLSFAYLRIVRWRVLRAFRNVPEDIRLKDVYWFSTPQEVEIASRVLRKWLKEDDEVLDPDAVKLAQLILQVGHAHFPDDPKFILALANFMISVQKNHVDGSSLLQHGSKLEEATLADRFMAFVRMEEQKQRSKTHDPTESGSLDLVTYVEFQRNYRLLARTQRDALMAIRRFWKTLHNREHVEFGTLSEILKTSAEATRHSDRVFRVMLERYPNNEHLYRMYARFLEHVRSDPWTAQGYAEAAEKLEEEQTQAGACLLGQDNANSLLENVNEKIHSVIVINAQGIMLVVNKIALKLFGYKKTELEGKNISMLMPNPFSARHNGYLRNFVNTGKKKILDSVREVVALHKNRSVFPVQLAVTKVSGVGNDAVFMGVMRPYVMEPGVIRVWCTPSGGVISVDERFYNSFGKTYADVSGRPFSVLVRDQDVIIKLLERAQAASEEEFHNGKVRQASVFMLHKYMDPVEVDIDVSLGGTDTQRLLAFNIRLVHSQGMLQVVDASGKVLYMNEDMRKCLGVEHISAIKKAHLSQMMPVPFNMLHGKWMKEPSAKIPKQSCRCSATVVMLDQHGKPMPIKPKIKTLEVDESVYHGVEIQPSSWEKGLDERRITFTIDTQGIVQGVNENASTSLFGFSPFDVIGKSVSCVVDVLSALESELPSVLAKMAQKVMSKPGHSWRVGVFPPSDKSMDQLSIMERLVREKSTRPGLMLLELVESEQEDAIPEIKLHIYRAEMITGVIQMDHRGIITKPACCVLHPSGLLFGTSARNMNRQPITRYLRLPGKGPESLLQDDKVKGAMKKGTMGKKIGPLKSISGIHSDGMPLHLNVLAVSTSNKCIVAKCSFESTEHGSADLFRASLEGKEGRSRRASASRIGLSLEGARSMSLDLGQHTLDAVGAAAAAAVAAAPAAAVPGVGLPEPGGHGAGFPGGGGGGGAKTVKFAGVEKESASAAGSGGSSTGSSRSGEGELDENEEEEEEEAEAAAAAVEEEEPSEEEEEDAEQQRLAAAANATDTYEADWQRGRRLKKLHQLLKSKQATQPLDRLSRHMIYILAMILAVHTVLFAIWVVQVKKLDVDVHELDQNGETIIAVEAIVKTLRKLKNLYAGITFPGVYEMNELEMQITLERLEDRIEELEHGHQQVYLGSKNLRQIDDEFQLRELWEGDSLQEDLYVDARVPFVQEDKSNLWLSGNQFIASARELLHRHESIAEATNNNLRLDRDWQYVMHNGPEMLAKSYTQSLSALLQKDLQTLETTISLGWGLMAVDLVIGLIAIVWALYLLQAVSHVRHALMSVFLLVPASLMRALADKQVKMIEEENEGGTAVDDDDEDQPQQQQQQQDPAQAVASLVGLPALRQLTAGQKHNNNNNNETGKPSVVVDVRMLSSAATAQSLAAKLRARLMGSMQTMGKRMAVLATSGKLLSNFREEPIVVGKRKLLRYRLDTMMLMAPLVLWWILVLILFCVATTTQHKLGRHVQNSYLADRIEAMTATVISDVHNLVSHDTLGEVESALLDGTLSLKLTNLEHLYESLLYGSEEKLDLSFLELDGTLFDAKHNEHMFFRDEECHVQFHPEKYCYEPSHTFYHVTRNGIDPMIQNLIDRVKVVLNQNATFIFENKLGVPSMDYILDVGWNGLLWSLHLASEFYSQNATTHQTSALAPHIALFVIAWLAAAAYYFLLFKPFMEKLTHEARQVSEMLSHLPAELALEAAVTEALQLNRDQEDTTGSGSHKSAPEKEGTMVTKEPKDPKGPPKK